MAEAGATIKITIRQSSGEQFEVTIAPSSTVLELKTQCTEKTQLPAESQRLIFKGKHHSNDCHNQLEFKKI